MKKHAKFASIIMILSTSLTFSLVPHDDPLDSSELETTHAELLQRIENQLDKYIGFCTKSKARAIATLVLNTKPELCVEVGVFGGASLFPMLEAIKENKLGHAYAVDAWDNNTCIRYMEDGDPNRTWWSKVDLKFIKSKFLSSSKKLNKYYTVLHGDSVAKAAKFKDNSIEFLHLNGNHSFEGAKREIEAYLPKVKSNGYILISDVLWSVNQSLPIANALSSVIDDLELLDTIDGNNVYLLTKDSE